MGRGLGPIQKALLVHFNEMPGGGGLTYPHEGYSEVNVITKFKEQYYPELYGPDRPMPMNRPNTLYWYRNQIYSDKLSAEEVKQHQRSLNKARVTICLAMKALLKRKYLIEWRRLDVHATYSCTSSTRMYITDEGRQAIL